MTRRRITIVGSGTKFLSGVSYYTILLVDRLVVDHEISVILMRNLVPKFLYPGRERVGDHITDRSTADVAPTFDGVDWTTIPSLVRATRFLKRQRPDIIVLQWWSASSLPAYLTFAQLARRWGIPVVIELHEDLHAAEASIPILGPLARRGLRRLIKSASSYVVHSEYDRARFTTTYGLAPDRVWVIPCGPFTLPGIEPTSPRLENEETTILFFGTIRPYKGLEDLVDAFDLLPRTSESRWRLLIVGESWEGWTLPFEKIAASANQADIEVINRYVTDEEVPALFERANIVALPYLESSVSGPLQMTMTMGLPVVVTDVGGLADATAGYEGAVLVQPKDPVGLAAGIITAEALSGQTYRDPHSWDDSARDFDALFDVVSKVKS